MSAETQETTTLHGGRLVARRLKAYGVTKLFTLSGGHLFSIYDGCRAEGIDLVDTRHESAATFAAEGWAKVTREPGVAALTAGPGVTNGMSAIASAQQNHSPILVLGGRAPAMRWGQGSLQEIDHVPFVRPLVKLAATAGSTAEIPGLIDDAWDVIQRDHPGPAFLDFPLDVVFMEADEAPLPSRTPTVSRADSGALDRAAALLREAERPVIMAGTNLYWGHGEDALRELAEAAGIPVFLNGLARGCLPADHPNFFARARSPGSRAPTSRSSSASPWTSGSASAARSARRPRSSRSTSPSPSARTRVRSRPSATATSPRRCGRWRSAAPTRASGSVTCAGSRPRSARPSASNCRTRGRRCTRCACTASSPPVLDRDAIVVGDGGDFVSYAGRVVDSYNPGCWLDPGPFGCLGSGPGYALAAKLAHPDRQVVLLLGDGAFGFSGMEFDTLARHGVNVVGVMGNNGIWALEKHPMEFLYGYSVVAELTPETRYDQMVEALGGIGELVRTPDELRPALERAFSATGPVLVNVLTDPSVAYPRSANLA